MIDIETPPILSSNGSESLERHGECEFNHRVCSSLPSPDSRLRPRYLQDLPLYQTVKPYWCSLPPSKEFDPDKQRLDNLEFESRLMHITDIRGIDERLQIEMNGFEVLDHATEIDRFASPEDVREYKRETEELLKTRLSAVHVRCYDLALRKNIIFNRTEFDLNDPLHTEGPVRGAHNGLGTLVFRLSLGTHEKLDISRSFGPQMINKHLSEAEKRQYIRPGYRFRIVK